MARLLLRRTGAVAGLAAVWGTIAAGLFATKAVNPAGADGLFAGNPAQLWIQLKAAGTTLVWSLAATRPS